MRTIIAIAIVSVWTMAGVNQWNRAQESKTLPYLISAADAAEIEKARQTVQLTAAPNPPEDGDLFIWKDSTLEHLLVTSSLKTNVVYWDNGLMECPTCVSRAAIAKAMGYYPYLDYHDTSYPGHDSRPFKVADERRWITNIIRVHTLTFPWRGQTNIVTSEEIVWGVTNHQYLKTEWSAQPPESEVWKTSPPINLIGITNSISIKP